ncbi:MAG: RNA 3'-terminal phosphate cyclase [Myxococcota bacterium]
MIEIDGSMGEGGGQILRSSLALSALTGKAFSIKGIRAGRKKPGLMRQHLTAVRAAAEICSAKVRAAELSSQELTFEPGDVVGGDYHFAVGTAGSACLVLQTVLPPLLRTPQPSRLVLEGGTHNPYAPPFDFLSETFLPVLSRMGVKVEARLDRVGFYPAGGGRIEVAIAPSHRLKPLTLMERGAHDSIEASVLLAELPKAVAAKEVEYLSRDLGLDASSIEVIDIKDSPGPGNVILIRVKNNHHTEVFTGFGQKGVPASRVVGELATSVTSYLKKAAPVGVYLADQLIIPLAMAGGGSFRTVGVTAHTSTNVEVVTRFLDVSIDVQRQERGNVLVDVAAR